MVTVLATFIHDVSVDVGLLVILAALYVLGVPITIIPELFLSHGRIMKAAIDVWPA